MVGVMLPRKGHRILLEAIASLVLNPTFMEVSPLFLIEGEGGYVEDLKRYAEDSGIGKYVNFIGAEENIYNLYSLLDFLVYPSIVDEDFPNVISEALGMGVPVVASKVAGAVDQIQDGIHGFLFERGSSAALSAIILEICINFDSYQGMAVEARKKYHLYYSPDVAVQRYLQLYARC
jgi:glycosyltransferase involved in cell wall biosynthesis